MKTLGGLLRAGLVLLALLVAVPVGIAQVGGGVTSPRDTLTTIVGTLGANKGGTGIANNAAATLTRSGNHALTITTTGTTGVTFPTSGTLATSPVELASLATQATNTVTGNATSGTATPTALAVGSCSAAGSALSWTTNTGFGCNTSITAAAVPDTGITGAAWTTYTPTVTSLAGTITSYTASGRYRIVGKTVFVMVNVTITDNGTGSSYLDVTLPGTTAAARQVLAGRETATSGVGLTGTLESGTTFMRVATYVNAYPVATNSVVVMGGVYEAQ